MTAFVLPARSGHGTPSGRSHPEQTLQRQVVVFLSWALPPQTFWTSIAHGGGGKIRGMVLKGTGMKAGVPDLLLVWKGRPIFIELKAPKGGVVSEAQKAVHQQIVLAGGVVRVLRSVDELRDFLKLLGMPLQARLMPSERAALSASPMRRKRLDDEVPVL